VYQDFEELLAELNASRAEYLIGGAHALALHARPRATKDLDLYISPTRRNALRVVRAVERFFGGSAPSYVSVENLLDPQLFVQLGVAPVRVDFLPALATTTFAQAWRRRVSARFGAVPAHYLSLEDLIAEKQHFDRPQDRADLEHLTRANRRRVPRALAKAQPKRPRRARK
jgi:hypothetical protein